MSKVEDVRSMAIEMLLADADKCLCGYIEAMGAIEALITDEGLECLSALCDTDSEDDISEAERTHLREWLN